MDIPDALTSATNGMRAQTAQLDVIARNLANAATTGYRSRTEAFETYGPELAARTDVAQTQGSLRKTGVPTDLALVGPGYFAIATPDGVRYTRDGRLTIDPHGCLRDAAGNPLLGSLGPARFPQGSSILEDGRIVARGEVVDRLRVVTFDVPAQSLDSGLFAAPPGRFPKRSFASVRSGFLEDSGVDAIAQMTALISAERSFEADEKSLERTDESLRRLVTEVPVVRT
ncbi:MAG TPA: flagellar hook basal-body protein [Candidatus Acidoferrales bacterium]|nr:flagellar hook basal-body protein [Candidatus Acidoferrales bacterium]